MGTGSGKGKLRLGELLVESGVLSNDNLQKALDQQKWEKKPLGEVLVGMRLLTEEKLLETLSWQLKTPTVKLSDSTVDRSLITLLPEDMLDQKRILPIARRKNKLTLAMADPSDLGTIEEVRFLTSCDVEPVLTTSSAIMDGIDRIRSDQPFEESRWKSDTFTQNFDVHQTTVLLTEDGSSRILEESEEEKPKPRPKPKPTPLSSFQILKTGSLYTANMDMDDTPDLYDHDLMDEEAEETLMRLEKMLQFMVKKKASYLHLCVDAPPTLRLGGRFLRMKTDAMTERDARIFTRELLDQDQQMTLGKTGCIEATLNFEDIGRFGFNFFRQRGAFTITIRGIQPFVPSLSDLGFPNFLTKYLHEPRGLIVLAGAVGNGKSNTMAAMIENINREQSMNIMTIEDQIKFLYQHKKSNVNQRELGIDVPTIPAALKFVNRQDVNVVAVDEVRNRGDMLAILEAVDSGHLVIFTIDADSVRSTIEKIYDFFQGMERNKYAIQFSQNLLVIIAQRLIRRADKSGKVLAYEMLNATEDLKPLVRDAKFDEIAEVLDSSSQEGLISLDRYLAELYRRNIITQEVAVQHSKSILAS